MKALLALVVFFTATLVGGFASAQIGTAYCNANVNSTGSISRISATGSTIVPFNDVTLRCDSLPLHSVGFFMASRMQGFVASPPGSAGNLCLGSGIGRYSNSVLSSGTSGSVSLIIDLNAMPWSAAPTVVVPGDTVNFQYWHRDTFLGWSATSNFSEGIEIQFIDTPVPTMVPIAAGSFAMGSNAASGSPYFGRPDQQPVHRVMISQDFWMGATEVTQAEYQALMGTNPSFFPGSTLPVEQVDWDDARQYCAALTVQQTAAGMVPAGFEYRLPTEAEWEYACRAGTTTEFNVGASLVCGQARFLYSHHSNSSCNSESPLVVGSYVPNAWGLHDMHGNVSEWCLDTHAAYTAAAQTDPFAAGGLGRVFRGGSWDNGSDRCRSANRGVNNPGVGFNFLGFRVVLASVLVP